VISRRKGQRLKALVGGCAECRLNCALTRSIITRMFGCLSVLSTDRLNLYLLTSPRSFEQNGKQNFWKRNFTYKDVIRRRDPTRIVTHLVSSPREGSSSRSSSSCLDWGYHPRETTCSTLAPIGRAKTSLKALPVPLNPRTNE